MMSSMGYKLNEWVHKRDHARFVRIPSFFHDRGHGAKERERPLIVTSFAKSILLCHARTFDLYKKKFQPSQKGTIGIVYVSNQNCGVADVELGAWLMSQNCDWVEGVDDSAEGKEASQWVLDWVLGFVSPQKHTDIMNDHC